jgi:hypothetical protein
MGVELTLEESDWAGYIEDGTPYRAQVMDIKPKDRLVRGENIRRMEFRFRIISSDAHDGQDIWGSTSTKFVDHPGCKLKTWSEAILGRRLMPHYKMNTDDLLDRPCVIIVSKREWDQDGETRVRNEVRDVQPTVEVAAAMAATAKDEDEEF